VADRIVQALAEHGFTASDAKAYVALLKSHPATGYELASRSGVPRSAIYNVLRRLESQGLVNAIEGKPTRYVPLSADRLLEVLRARFNRNVETLKSSLADLKAEPSVARTWTVQGYDRILEQAESLVAGAQRSIYASLWRREADALTKALLSARESEVDIVLFSFNSLDSRVGKVLSYGIAEQELERYWEHKIILVVDETRALVGSAESEGRARAVVTEEPSLVEMAVSNLVLDVTLLGQRTGQPTEVVVTRLTRMLAPVEELLAHSLVDHPS
jgi:sugar-specific transcriptional regulator TrmB